MVGTLIRRPLPPVSDFIRTLLDDADAAAARATLGAETGTFTPTLTPGAGAFGSASAAGVYVKWGRGVWNTLVITVITPGTASGVINATLSHASDAGTYTILPGQEISTTGVACVGWILSGAASVNVTRYDGPTIIGANRLVVVSGSFRTSS